MRHEHGKENRPAGPLTVATMSAQELLRAEAAERAFYRHDCPGRFALELLEAMAPMPPHGMPVNIYRHSLQSATRCLRDGQRDELVVACLLHDLGSAFCNDNHAAVSAEILRPHVSAEVCWIVEHHALFQEHYYAAKLGLDPFRRDCFRDHPHYGATIEFCERWDVPAFDPAYKELPLETFAPLVRQLFAGVAQG